VAPVSCPPGCSLLLRRRGIQSCVSS
jgi:hypothetical protein